MWRINKTASIERYYRGAIAHFDNKKYCLPEAFICCVEKCFQNEIIVLSAKEQDLLIELVNLGILTKIDSKARESQMVSKL